MPEGPFEETSPFGDVNEIEETHSRRRRQAGGGGWFLPIVGGLLASVITSLGLLWLFTSLTTKPGEVIVEIDQPGATIYLDGTKVDVRVPGNMGPVTIPVHQGKHELHVTRRGFEPVTREFVLGKGKPKPILQVRMVPLEKRPGVRK